MLCLPGLWVIAFLGLSCTSTVLLFRLQVAANRNPCLGLVLLPPTGHLARVLQGLPRLPFPRVQGCMAGVEGEEKMKGLSSVVVEKLNSTCRQWGDSYLAWHPSLQMCSPFTKTGSEEPISPPQTHLSGHAPAHRVPRKSL